MFKLLRILLILTLLSTLAGGCIVSQDYQSLVACTHADDSNYIAPGSNADNATVTFAKVKRMMVTDEWHAVVTHVDCHPVAEYGTKIKLPAGKHLLRMRFNPRAEPGAPTITTIELVALSANMDNQWSRSAQNLELDVKPGATYELHMMTLPGYDSSFWIIEDGKIIAHTPNFKSEWAE